MPINDSLLQLSDAKLKALSASLREGLLAKGLSKRAIEQVVGSEGAHVMGYLERLQQEGFESRDIAYVVEAIIEARAQTADPTLLYDLVLSGPEVDGVPTADTAAVVQTLIAAANDEVLLVGYSVHNGKKLFEPLAERMKINPGLRVTFCLNIARPFGDTSLEKEILRRFGREFQEKHWPWPSRPDIYYDPRALIESHQRASLHAKCVIVDRNLAIVTSANFTEAAQNRNIEVGVIIRHRPTISRLSDYFLALIKTNKLVQLHPC